MRNLRDECPFCGESLSNGQEVDKEHFVPTWMMKLSKKRKKDAWLPQENGNWGHYPLQNYYLWAHKSCNFADGVDLETPASSAFKRIRKGRFTFHDVKLIGTLLDKIRIGIFLHRAQNMPPGGGVSPTFNIGTRLSRTNSFLSISRFQDQSLKGMAFVGIETEAFLRMPSAYGVWINDLLFSFYSSDCLLLEKFGSIENVDFHSFESTGAAQLSVSVKHSFNPLASMKGFSPQSDFLVGLMNLDKTRIDMPTIPNSVVEVAGLPKIFDASDDHILPAVPKTLLSDDELHAAACSTVYRNQLDSIHRARRNYPNIMAAESDDLTRELYEKIENYGRH